MEDSISCIRGTEDGSAAASDAGVKRGVCTCSPDTFVPAGEGPGTLSCFISILETLVHCTDTHTDRQTDRQVYTKGEGGKEGETDPRGDGQSACGQSEKTNHRLPPLFYTEFPWPCAHEGELWFREW